MVSLTENEWTVKSEPKMLMQPEVLTDLDGTILHNGNKLVEVDHVRNILITGQ